MKPIAVFALCLTCEGHGWIPALPAGPRTELCAECLGRGSQVTEEGRSIITLLGVTGLDELMPDA